MERQSAQSGHQIYTQRMVQRSSWADCRWAHLLAVQPAVPRRSTGPTHLLSAAAKLPLPSSPLPEYSGSHSDASTRNVASRGEEIVADTRRFVELPPHGAPRLPRPGACHTGDNVGMDAGELAANIIDAIRS